MQATLPKRTEFPDTGAFRALRALSRQLSAGTFTHTAMKHSQQSACLESHSALI
jgi:hypothetical protein